MPVLTKIGTNSINDNAVTAAKIPDGAVVADIADDAITGAKFANDIAISTTGNIATTGSGTLTVAGATNLASVATGTLTSADGTAGISIADSTGRISVNVGTASLRDLRGLTLRASCVISHNSPSSAQFNNDFNVSSISFTASAVTINFTVAIDYPITLPAIYSLSTDGNSLMCLASSQSNSLNQSSIAINYVKVDTVDGVAEDSGILSNAPIMVFGGNND